MSSPVRSARPRSFSDGSLEQDMSRLHLDLPLNPMYEDLIGTSRPRSRSLVSPPSGSQTTRNILISALTSVNPIEGLRELRSLEELSAIDLTVYVAAMLRLPYNADEKELLSLCILELALRFATMRSCSKERWGSLTDLLVKNPKLEELIAFLKEPDDNRADVDDEFVYLTWSYLARGLNSPTALSELGLEEVMQERVLPDWLKSQQVSSTTNHVLQLVYYMLMRERPQYWSIETFAEESGCQEFVLQALSSRVDTSMGYELLTKFLSKDFGRIAKFSHNSLLDLGYILQSTKETEFDHAICLAVLDNPCEDIEVIHAIICFVLDSHENLEVTFLYKLLERFVALDLPEGAKELSYILDIIERIVQKSWLSGHIAFTYDINGIFDDYRIRADLFIKNFLHFFIMEDVNSAQIRLDNVLFKYAIALVANLRWFGVENVDSLTVISKSARGSRVYASCAIKSAALRLVFHIFDYLDDIVIREKLFNLLKSALPKIRVTTADDEFVVNGDNEGLLTFTLYGTKESCEIKLLK